MSAEPTISAQVLTSQQLTNSPISVSVIVVVRNAIGHILPCIEAVEKQFLTPVAWELIVVDGMSTDGTREAIAAHFKTVPYPHQFLDNPGLILASGWNIGIRVARGAYVVRPDVHARLQAGYIEKGIACLDSMPNVAAVGGQLRTVAPGFWGRIIQSALSSKMGVGNSPFRVDRSNGYVDTAAYAVYRRSVFDEVGFFNENLVRHQDNDLHARIRATGKRFYLSKDMKADYHCRDSVRKLIDQMYFNGYYLPRLGISAIRIRHFTPFIFFGGLGLLSLSLLFWRTEALILTIVFLYMTLVFATSILLVKRKRDLSQLLNIGLIPLIHFSYALGMLFGILRQISVIGIDPFVADVIGWDVNNWARVLDYWEANGALNVEGKHGLEIGAHRGGISLYFAAKGAHMTCSDVVSPEPLAYPLHQKYQDLVKAKITYRAIDVLKLDEQNAYDFICFKSILGEVGRDGQVGNIGEAVRRIYAALKPGGTLFFCENLEVSPLHMLLRRMLQSPSTEWRSYWTYMPLHFYQQLFSQYSTFQYTTEGVIGAIGSTEWLRDCLGYLDALLRCFVPKRFRYILIGVVKKTA